MKPTSKNPMRLLLSGALAGMLVLPALGQRENTGDRQSGRMVDPGTANSGATARTQKPRSVAQPAPTYSGANGTVYVKRDGVALRSGAERNSSEVKTLTLGEELVVLGTEGIQMNVRTSDGKTGYVAKLNVNTTAPKADGGRGRVLIASDLGPNERSNVSSIRGLSPDAEKLVDGGQVSEEALEDVKKMESISESISDAQVDKFMEEGGVRPL